MKIKTVLLATLAITCNIHAATLFDSFEAGLDNWTALGNVSLVGNANAFQPVDGASMVLLTTGVGAVDYATWYAAGGAPIVRSATFITDPAHPSHQTPLVGSLLMQTVNVLTDAVLTFSGNSYYGGEGKALGGLSVTSANSFAAFGFGNINLAATTPSASTYDTEWGWHFSALPLAAGTYTLTLGVISFGEPGDLAVGLDNLQLVSPVGWFDYGLDGFNSDNPLPGLPEGINVPEPSAALLPLFAMAAALGIWRRRGA